MFDWAGQLPLAFGMIAMAIIATIVALDMLRPPRREALEKRICWGGGAMLAWGAIWLVALASGAL